jgi:hypothetical protein
MRDGRQGDPYLKLAHSLNEALADLDRPMSRSVLQRIHNPRGRQCGCLPECWCKRTAWAGLSVDTCQGTTPRVTRVEAGLREFFSPLGHVSLPALDSPPESRDPRGMALAAPILGLGGLGIALVIAIPIALIILVGYSIWTLRKPEGWEQK